MQRVQSFVKTKQDKIIQKIKKTRFYVIKWDLMQYLLWDKPMKENNLSYLYIKWSFYSIFDDQIEFLIFLIQYLKLRKKRTFHEDREAGKIRLRDVPEILTISRTSPCPILRLCAVREDVLYMDSSFLLLNGDVQRTRREFYGNFYHT